MPLHEDDSFSHEDTFVELLGSPGRVKILEVFLTHAETTLTAGDIAELADVSESTFSRNVDKFLDLDLVERAGKVGKTSLYTLNTESPLAADLARARHRLRGRAASLDPDLWAVDDDGGSPRSETTEAKHTAELVTQLFDETTDRRGEIAERLANIAESNPEAVVDTTPALVELTDDEDSRVVRHAIEAVMNVVEEYPDVLDEEDTSRLLNAVVENRRTADSTGSNTSPGLLDRLRSGSDEVRSKLGGIADARPEERLVGQRESADAHSSKTEREDRPKRRRKTADHEDS